MLTDTERHEIESHLSQYPYKRAACIEALKIVQREHGWVSDEHLCDIAALLDMTPDELDNVATFYNLIFRKPVGRHPILLCDSVSCWILRCDSVREALRQRLGIGFGETSADGRFTLLPIQCLGACDRAPALMVDEDLHVAVAPESLDAILARYE